MKKYFILFMLFIMSLLLVYKDNVVYSDSYYNHSIYVFYEVGNDVVENPDTSDIHFFIFLVFFYNLILGIMLFFDRKKIIKYCDVNV